MSVTISIIIPTYNHRQALERCLASIGAQTYRDFEVIVVDDGSTDDTSDWIKDFQKRFTGYPLLVTRYSNNRGANAARNTGLQKARGEYVIFCDADVVMRPDMLEKMKAALNAHPEASYAYSSFKFGWKTFKLWPFDAEKLRQMPYIHSTSFIRRAHVPKGGWDESLKRLQDWDFFLTMLEEGHRGIWIPETLFTVAVRKAGMSQWLPSFAYKFPWLPSVKRYYGAETIVRKKHHLLPR